MREGTHPIDELLDARGSSKRWLAKKLGVDETALNKFLSGDRNPPEGFYERIADVLHVPVRFIRPPEQPAAV